MASMFKKVGAAVVALAAIVGIVLVVRQVVNKEINFGD